MTLSLSSRCTISPDNCDADLYLNSQPSLKSGQLRLFFRNSNGCDDIGEILAAHQLKFDCGQDGKIFYLTTNDLPITRNLARSYDITWLSLKSLPFEDLHCKQEASYASTLRSIAHFLEENMNFKKG